MTELVVPGEESPDDRRRDERRLNSRLFDLSLPELRRITLTWLLTVVVVSMFLWMVRDVLIAGVLGIVIAAYLRPLYLRIKSKVRKPIGAAVLTLLIVIVPILGALAYSYSELVDVLGYISTHQSAVASQIDASIRKLPFLADVNATETIRRYVLMISDYGSKIPGEVREAIVQLSVAITIFLLTAAYVFTDADSIVSYVRSKVPQRYDKLRESLVTNVRCVERIDMTLAEYEALRSDPHRFVVAPDESHVVPEAEVVVEQTERYWVVEKVGVAGKVAVELEPGTD